MANKNIAVFIGRFQPNHNAHLKIIESAAKENDLVLILVGSYRTPRTTKNPFSHDERADMLINSLPMDVVRKVVCCPIRDYVYSDLNWVVSVQNVVRNKTIELGYKLDEVSYKLYGHFKDDSSFYLNCFPQWSLVRKENIDGINSKDIREAMFLNGRDGVIMMSKHIHPYVKEFLLNFTDTELFKNLQKEFLFVKKYREEKQWAQFEPTFCTTDVVVVMSGHVLLVKRGLNPGKGRFALPGGFVQKDKTIFESALAELKEETCIVYPKEKIKSCLKKQHVFDHPKRDTRGRTITHAFYFELPMDELPNVKGDDDAAEAFWMPLADLTLHEENFFSDHLHIINYFVYGN